MGIKGLTFQGKLLFDLDFNPRANRVNG